MLNLFESVHNEMETKSLVINHNCEDTDEIIAEKSEQNCCVVLKEPASQTECQGELLRGFKGTSFPNRMPGVSFLFSWR